jgi:hypothetical protein
MKELTFDKIFHKITKYIPFLGKHIWKYYVMHGWFSRTAKFIVTTTILFWFVKGPLISLFTSVFPAINLYILIVPSYLLGAFVTGIIISIIGVVFNEVWIYKK